MRGKFITFEGGEGSGKSTQLKFLARRFSAQRIPHTVTREPGGTDFAEKLRGFILSPDTPDRTTLAEILLFLAARADHVDKVIRPALEAGQFVLCDRFSDSTAAYQCLTRGGLSLKDYAALEAVVLRGLTPDTTIMLDVSAETGLRRAAHRRGNSKADAFEGRGEQFHRDLRESYKMLAYTNQPRCCLVNTDGVSIDDVANHVWECVRTRHLS